MVKMDQLDYENTEIFLCWLKDSSWPDLASLASPHLPPRFSHNASIGLPWFRNEQTGKEPVYGCLSAQAPALSAWLVGPTDCEIP